MNIEITIPVLNEQDSIIEKINHLNSYVEKNLCDLGDVKIIIANNGSVDNTKVKAQILERELDRVEYLELNQKGVGLALKFSWKKSKADIVGYMDLDLATDLQHLNTALDMLITSKADIVTGSRLKKGSNVRGRSLLRSISSISFNAIIKVLFNVSFSDGMCGFKFLNRKIVNKLIENGANSDGWFFATEILVVGDFLNYKIHDLPVLWTDSPNSKVKVLSLTIDYLGKIFRLKKLLLKKKLTIK